MNRLKKLLWGILLISLITLGTVKLNKTEQNLYFYQLEDAKILQQQQKFIKQIATEAKKLQAKNHLFASITIAQAILESDWGNSELATESNNLFGIKETDGAEASILPTDEYENGQRITIHAAFKKYPTIEDSLSDHMVFLEGASYAPVKASQDYREAAYALQKGGYATDPAYAEKLIELIEQFELNRFDL
ncbi:glycoside hydrolase family 73 protein [Carnobacterium gallinarum]|uniref:glycoside hydrolase family 73 protein n=1 Tax=Carnobacterium gallinarum TaxID=2749 RepID=UPI000556FA30|nr:glycoside hydrolase family 73 protein [Carnobacterium gallinarum]